MNEPRLALTFDAEHPSRSGADPDAPSRILDALEEAGVRAAFFVQGRWATAYAEVARRIANDGHLVGNHSNYHAAMTLLSPEGLRTDVREAERRIVRITGVDPRPWFRCPFGDGADRTEIRVALAELGYTDVSWDIDSGDWEDDATPQTIASIVMDGLRGRVDTGIVLFHAWPAATAAVMPQLLAALAREGTTFVQLEELVHVP